ncbi:MAG: histidine--tRNA ligase [Candidatus Omnitrophica bacterium]|nr:histidine--tRNA ligase [Candidatus Omnitrophota bacterium]
MFKRVPGTKDILVQEVYSWQEIEKISRSVFSIFNYCEIRPPVIEDASLFNRSLGEFTEIVQKQMFLIRNQEDLYALRPEGTASIVRAYVENNLDKTAGLKKFYYMGPMFRLERPQKGRLRQFHHIGIEVIGSSQAEVDVEVISLADKLLKSYQVSGYEIKINTLGCVKDKKELVNLLQKDLRGKLDSLCPECKVRFDHNILRILDCKNESCKKIIEELSIGDRHLCEDCKNHFKRVLTGLDALKIKYEVLPTLVRGLDYYTQTVFEVKHKDLGSQDAIGAGGRYDNLVKELGGEQTGAIGFAFGVERLMLVSKLQNQKIPKNLVFVITLGDEAKAQGLVLLNNLRNAGIPADTDYEGKSLKGAMRLANDLEAKYVLILGDNEIKKNVVMLKDMASGEQKEIGISNLISELRSNS